jgi:hypothetical protein
MWSDEQAAGQSQVGYAARRTRSLQGLQMAAECDDHDPWARVFLVIVDSERQRLEGI